MIQLPETEFEQFPQTNVGDEGPFQENDLSDVIQLLAEDIDDVEDITLNSDKVIMTHNMIPRLLLSAFRIKITLMGDF